MPIEILELIIKAKVAASETSRQSESDGNAQGKATAAALAPVEKAVREITNILKRKNER